MEIPHEGPVNQVNLNAECPNCHRFGHPAIVVLLTREDDSESKAKH
jgi:hypothetical protein